MEMTFWVHSEFGIEKSVESEPVQGRRWPEKSLKSFFKSRSGIRTFASLEENLDRVGTLMKSRDFFRLCGQKKWSANLALKFYESVDAT